MTTIGTFTKTLDGRFQGAIRTLTLNVKGIEIRPVEPTAEKAPDHRVFVGQTELGAAWAINREGKPPCLSIRLDDPSLPAPLSALLIAVGEAYRLQWSRPGTR